jgi:uncharacterized protein
LSTLRIKTPCIGICSTTSVGDPICRGCKRFAHEVINWNGYTDVEKNAVLDRIEKLLIQILDERFYIRDPSTLKETMRSIAIPFDAERSQLSWLHNLLKKHHREIRSLHHYGVEVREEYRHIALAELIEQVDKELLVLCEAHYSRYFSAG